MQHKCGDNGTNGTKMIESLQKTSMNFVITNMQYFFCKQPEKMQSSN